jgi:hypothetical protein
LSVTFSLKKSREELIKQGYDTWIVEKPWNQYTKKREDLFHFADLVAIRDDIVGVTAIQGTGEDASSHVKKLLEGFADAKGNAIPPNPHLRTWLKTGNRFFIWSWRLRGKKGKRKLYKLRQIEFFIENNSVIHREIPEVEVED